MIGRAIPLSIILALTLIAGHAFSDEYWKPANSPTSELLRRLCFIDSLTGWAAGDRGTIIHTTNGGDTWKIQNTEVETGIVDVFFLNKNTGWALIWSVSNPAGTIVLKSKNGGENWISENYPESGLYMKKVFFMDSLRGWMGGSPDAFVYTTDGGTEWTDVVIDSGGLGHLPVINFSFFDSGYGFANGGAFDLAGVIWKTVNGGINWFSAGVGPEPVQQIVFFDSLHALGVGGDFEYGTGIVRTSDAGENWEYTSLGVAGVATAVSFRTTTEGWACLGSAQKFILTNDSGKTWTEVPTPNHSKIFDLTFTDSLYGYAVGDAGTILKYDSTVVGVNSERSAQLASTIELDQNFPNPFNPETVISYRLAVGSTIELTIYDILGEKVKELVNEPQPAGEYHVVWNGRNEIGRKAASGIYLYQLRSGKFAESRKMLLLR